MNLPVALLRTVFLSIAFAMASAAAATPESERDILVTFDNSGARAVSNRPGPTYSQRKRYSIARQVRLDASAVARQYGLAEVDHWPIRSLSVYCFVFRVAEGVDRASIIQQLVGDTRIESAQPLQLFETGVAAAEVYDDTYRRFQYGLDALNIAPAHRASTGRGIRIAIVDSTVDDTHEDLAGRVRWSRSFSAKGVEPNDEHGTAVASVIGARSNNAKGIVGIAPDSELDIYVSCWGGGDGSSAICDSFSLSKALDAMLDNPPDILNLSLRGPHDPLLERLLDKAAEAGIIIVGAGASGEAAPGVFPSDMDCVLGVDSSSPAGDQPAPQRQDLLYAPGRQILVALPVNQYDFRSGSSLAAAHVTGVIALLLAIEPEVDAKVAYDVLLASQHVHHGGELSIDACRALNLLSERELCDAGDSERERHLDR